VNAYLDPSSLRLLSQPDGLRQFRQRCGDGYVSLISTGGLLIGRLQISNTSRIDKSATDAGLSGGGGGVSVSGNVKTSALNNYAAHTVDMQTIEIGTDRSVTTSTVSDFTKAFDDYGLQSGFSPRKYKIEILSYSTLPSWPRRAALDLRRTPSALQALTLYQQRFQDIEQRYAFIRANGQNYYNIFYSDWHDFDTAHERLSNMIVALNELINQCSANYGAGCAEIVAADDLKSSIATVVARTALTKDATYAAGSIQPMFDKAKVQSGVAPPQTVLQSIEDMNFPNMALDYFTWMAAAPLERNDDASKDELKVILARQALTGLLPKIANKSLSSDESAKLRNAVVDELLNTRFENSHSEFCRDTMFDSALCNVGRTAVDARLRVLVEDKGVIVPPPPLPPPPPTQTERRKQPVIFCPPHGCFK
jgi:hypothetical protein